MFVAGWINHDHKIITLMKAHDDLATVMEWLVMTGREIGLHFSQDAYEKLGGEYSHVHFGQKMTAFLIGPEAQV